jgi:hypothetical protein
VHGALPCARAVASASHPWCAAPPAPHTPLHVSPTNLCVHLRLVRHDTSQVVHRNLVAILEAELRGLLSCLGNQRASVRCAVQHRQQAIVKEKKGSVREWSKLMANVHKKRTDALAASSNATHA